jgi:GTP cyclohydrolase II
MNLAAHTQPPFDLTPQAGWFGDGTGRGEEGNTANWKIVSFDPWGAMSQELWAKEYKEGLDVRPTISQTKAHIKIEELDVLARKGELPVDGDIVIKSPDLPAFPGVDQGIEINTYKAAIEPVWHLPGIAERLGIDESTLRRALFEDTGGMYPELLTRPDIKTFLPPIGGITVYIFGDPAKLADPNTEVTCRPHDSCSGSDVFGSDICTCRPYLIFGIAEAIKCAQRGGVGVIGEFGFNSASTRLVLAVLRLTCSILYQGRASARRDREIPGPLAILSSSGARCPRWDARCPRWVQRPELWDSRKLLC